jgi:hypothetical protein
MLITPHPPTSQSGCGSNMGQISVKTYAATGSLLSDNQHSDPSDDLLPSF